MVDATKSTQPRARRPAPKPVAAATPKPALTEPVPAPHPAPTAHAVPVAHRPAPTSQAVPVTQRPVPTATGFDVPVPTIGLRRVHVRVPHLPSAALAQPHSLTARVQHGAAGATRAASALAARPLAAAVGAGVWVAGRARSAATRRPRSA